MTNSTEIETVASPPPFTLASTVTVNFTTEQLVGIALDTLTARGHIFDPSTVKSVFSKTGLKLTVESVEGDAPKKSVKRRKKASKKVSKKTETKQTEKKEEVAEKPEKKEDLPSVGNNPFPSTTDKPKPDPKEEAIAAVKEEAGVPVNAAFSTDTVGIEESESGEAPAFDFGAIGNTSE